MVDIVESSVVSVRNLILFLEKYPQLFSAFLKKELKEVIQNKSLNGLISLELIQNTLGNSLFHLLIREIQRDISHKVIFVNDVLEEGNNKTLIFFFNDIEKKCEVFSVIITLED